MRKTTHTALFLVLAILGLAAAAAAAQDVVIKGVVNDDTGKPIRGALVKVSMAGKNVVRFSQTDGRYELPVPAGSYTIGAEAFGYAAKTAALDTSKSAEADFSLSPRWDVEHLSGAEIMMLVPDDAPGKLIKGSCVGCHDFATVLHKRGQTADEWKAFLPTMTKGRRRQPVFSPAKLDALSVALEKYFGPNAQYFGPDAVPPTREQVHHPAMADEVLKSTIREYAIPEGGYNAFAHTIFLDQSSQTAWFCEIGIKANKIGRFDIETEKFTEYDLKPPFQEPHSGVVGKDGTIWVTLEHRSATKIISLDPKTGKIEAHDWPEEPGGAHTISLDQAGNLWISGSGLWSYDTKTGKFKNHPFAIPDKPPVGSSAEMQSVPGEPGRVDAGTYHVVLDSKGTVWASSLDLGIIVSLNPKTGETKEYQPPNTPGIRGIMADKQDNIWFSDWFHHRLGKLDQKTGVFTMYQPPTLGANPYGIVLDKYGYIWYADLGGNNITRFDPVTAKFVEYPLPSHPSYPRFIDVANDGRVWFTEYWSGKIGVLDPGEEARQIASR